MASLCTSAAHPQKMAGKVAFVSTDPTFLIVHRALTELGANQNYKIIGSSTVSSNSLQGNDMNNVYRWKRWHDFARTAAAVLRMYMLKATGMLDYHDPELKKLGKERNLAAIVPNPPYGEPINMAANKEEAERLSAEFDRLFPHFIIQGQFKNMQPRTTRSFSYFPSNLMYVTDFPNSQLYHIVAKLTVTLVADGPAGLIIHAVPFVNAIKYQLNLPTNQEMYPHYTILKEVFDQYNALLSNGEPIENLEQEMAGLNMGNNAD